MAIVNGIDLEIGQKVIEAVKNNPVFGKTMWQAKTVWQGGTKAESDIRGFKVATDEPRALGGTDTAPNPVEMVLAALGSSLVVGYSLNAAMLGIELQNIEVEVEGDIDLPGFFGLPSDVLPRYTNVRAKVFLQSAADHEQLEQVHRRVTATSPVGLSLSKDVKLDIELVNRRPA